jgi:hypothetical protein
MQYTVDKKKKNRGTVEQKNNRTREQGNPPSSLPTGSADYGGRGRRQKISGRRQWQLAGKNAVHSRQEKKEQRNRRTIEQGNRGTGESTVVSARRQRRLWWTKQMWGMGEQENRGTEEQ